MIQVLKNWYKTLFNDPNAATLFLLITFICLIIYFFTDVLAPILLALGVAYLFEWPIGKLEQNKILNRTFSTSLFLFLFFLFLIGGTILLIPILVEQSTALINKVPEMLANLETYVITKTKEYPKIVEYVDLSAIADQSKDKIADFSTSFIKDKLLVYLMNVTSFVVYLFIVPLLAFFMLKDKNVLLDGLKVIFPPNLSLATKLWVKMNQQLMNYISGKVLHILIIAIVNYIAFLIFGLNYSLLLGISVGLSVVIPYVGAAIVTVPIVAIALFQFGLGSTFITIMVVYLVIQVLDGNVLTPILFSEKMKLHPFVILCSVLVFGSLWGFWGVFFAIPLATLIKTIITLWPRGEYSENNDDQEDPKQKLEIKDDAKVKEAKA